MALQSAVPDAKVIIEPMENDPREMQMTPLDVSRIRNVFGFEPSFSLVDGLSDYIKKAGFSKPLEPEVPLVTMP